MYKNEQKIDTTIDSSRTGLDTTFTGSKFAL